MSKEPLKSFINKVGTFRGKKHSQNNQQQQKQQRPSSTDLRFGQTPLNENDESVVMRAGGGSDESSLGQLQMPDQSSTSFFGDLDTTTKSISTTSHLFRLD